MMAAKDVDGETVVAVAVRGGKYGDEWGSNGRVGRDGEALGYHYGFRKSAEDALVQLKEYAAENEISLGEAKIWITGFSRGAAVSNVLAAILVDEGAVDPANLYAYTFATPSTVSQSRVTGEYPGIYNVVNPLDIVTRLPMNVSGTSETASGRTINYDWDYVKYGETVELHFSIQRIYRLLFGAGENFEIYDGAQILYFVPSEKRSAVEWYMTSMILNNEGGSV
jgi:hypothetical protein